MKCNAMLFDLEQRVNKEKTATNSFLTFVDSDTGDSYKCFVDSVIAAKYSKLKECEITLSITIGDYKGKPQLNIRILHLEDIKKSFVPKAA